jgi:hypothetical protein
VRCQNMFSSSICIRMSAQSYMAVLLHVPAGTSREAAAKGELSKHVLKQHLHSHVSAQLQGKTPARTCRGNQGSSSQG